MKPTTKVTLSALLIAGLAVALAQHGGGNGNGHGPGHGPQQMPPTTLTVELGRPTDRSIALNVISPTAIDAYAEYGTAPGAYTSKSSTVTAAATVPVELELAGLTPDTRYYYRLQHRADKGSFTATVEQSFTTARPAGITFTFGVEGDSHPERAGKMFDAALFQRTLEHVRDERPDFYIMLGDDFSIEKQIGDGDINQPAINRSYQLQRDYLATTSASTPIFLVNGNHEEAGGFMRDGKADNAAVLAGHARTQFFALPAPDNSFYTGDATPIEYVGLIRDYYAWTWGDALFVVIDPYWHSKVDVDEPPGGRHGQNEDFQRNRDLWQVSLGDEQYFWLKKTLESSHAKYKFVFAHHVLGTGRGGIEESSLCEWGGNDPRGENTFKQHRSTWPMPIHELFVKYGVTIFFQGHDHLFAHQQRDGVIYQETPNPADFTYTAFNADAYRSGDILPNAGHLRITVSPASVRVDYIRSFLPKDENPKQKDGMVAFSYTVPPRSK